MQVGFCTNATTLTDAQISELAGIGGVHANVSLDGFRAESHGRFRGDRDSFAVTVATVRKLAAAGLLQGLLCTPNSLAEDEEYRELCEFAAGNGASYVLMNPLSSMGRGVKSRGKLSSGEEHMRRIRALTAPFDSPDLEIVHIRFPSTGGQPLAGCEAGTIIYVFTAGEVTVCPYLVFAARTPQSRHDPGEFIVGNIFTDPDIAARLDAYRFTERYEMGANPTCRSCGIAGQCGKGCPAAVIAAGRADRCGGRRGLPRHLRGAAAAAGNDRMTGQPGLFISIDGPGGSGKSTLAALVAARLARRGLAVRQTREPSPTPLGQLIRAGTDDYAGMALACLVAGDRHHHLATEIRPGLAAGQIIICDRYLPASLVLQRMDGISWDVILQLNQGADQPALAVILNGSPAVIAARLAARGRHSRFERQPGSSQTESVLYTDTAARLAQAGWPVWTIDITTRSADQAAMIVTDRILVLHADANPEQP